MTLKLNDNYLGLIVLSFTILLSSCAQSPWQQVLLPELEEKEYHTLFKTVSQYHQSCNKRFDAEATLSLKSSLKNEKIKGYLAAIIPYRGKFIVTTPLGQPAYIATVNGNEFQSINVLNHTYQSGYTEDIIDEFNLPQSLKNVEFGKIVEGKITSEMIEPNIIRQDSHNRGIWFSFVQNNKEEHILLTQAKGLILERIIANKGDDTITIKYADHELIANCLQPQLITISGLSYGAEIEIQLENILPQPLLTSRDFHVKIPEDYTRQGLKN